MFSDRPDVRPVDRGTLVTVLAVVWVVLIARSVAAQEPPAPAPPAAAAPWAISPPVMALAVASFLAYVITIPGLMLYFAGMVRRKNVLSVMMQCMTLMFVLSIVWVAWGYSLAFGEGRFIGGATQIGGVELGHEGDVASMALARCFFFGASFVLAGCLLCGALVERMRLISMILFGILWGTFVFCPLCHWTLQGAGVLGSGWFSGTLDSSGALAIHVAAGTSALTTALTLGRRLGYGMDDMRPHNLTYATMGASLIWLGALGLHFGYAVARQLPAAGLNAILFTHLSMASAAIGWAGLEWMQRRKASVLGIASGAVAGFSAAAAGAAVIDASLGILVGVLAGGGALAACGPIKRYFGYDDSLDVFGVHAVGGAVGLVAAAALASPADFGGSADDWGIASRLLGAVWGLGLTVGYSAGVSLLIVKLLDLMIGLRVPQETEMLGLDLSEHGQEGYIFH